MCESLNQLYEERQQPCVFAILLLGSERDRFHEKVKALFRTWLDAIANVLIESSLDQGLAKQRGQDAAISIQGSLILSQGLDDPSPFQGVIQQLPQELWRDL